MDYSRQNGIDPSPSIKNLPILEHKNSLDDSDDFFKPQVQIYKINDNKEDWNITMEVNDVRINNYN